MKKFLKIVSGLSLLLALLFLTPIPAFAQSPDECPSGTHSDGVNCVPDSGDNAPANNGLVTCTGADCDWKALINMINNIIQFILFKMVIPIAAIMFAYAGFKMVTAGSGAAEARTQAKSIFMNTLLGLVIAAAAWLIITTILSILGWDGGWIGLKFGV